MSNYIRDGSRFVLFVPSTVVEMYELKIREQVRVLEDVVEKYLVCSGLTCKMQGINETGFAHGCE